MASGLGDGRLDALLLQRASPEFGAGRRRCSWLRSYLRDLSWRTTLPLLMMAMLCVAVAIARTWQGASAGGPRPVPPPPQRKDGGAFVYHPKYDCGICEDVVDARQVGEEEACAAFRACAVVNASVVSCSAMCNRTADPARLVHASRVPPTLNLRVAKALGSKDYDLLRVSVVTRAGSEEHVRIDATPFDYSDGFKYRWTGYALHSSLVRVHPGEETKMRIQGTDVRLHLPRLGEATVGVVIADPCVTFGDLPNVVDCMFGERYDLARRIPALLNAFVGGELSDVDWWASLGDNLYDRHGAVTEAFFNSLTVETKSRVFMTVPGNHDYWAMGTPLVSTEADHFGNAFMQVRPFGKGGRGGGSGVPAVASRHLRRRALPLVDQWYGQDTIAAQGLGPGSRAAPFDFSVDPDEGRQSRFGGQIVDINNTFFYNAVGNAGIIGFSGAYTFDETLPLVREACLALEALRPHVRVVLLFGHWDVKNLGCQAKMDVPNYYDVVASLPGCDAFAWHGMLKFFMGHTHCNVPHPHGHVDTGFMVRHPCARRKLASRRLTPFRPLARSPARAWRDVATLDSP